MTHLLLTLCLLFLPAIVSAQIHGEVRPDRVMVGAHEFVPRFATMLPNVLVVPKGQTVTLPEEATYDAIEVAGTLRVSRDHDTTLRVTHLLILPGGTLDVGTASDPMLRQVEIIIRDVPLDHARDPWQWGNGIVNFGKQTRVGRSKTAFLELGADAEAGATSLTLGSVPEGWSEGDVLVLPDTLQTVWGRSERAPRREVTAIAAIRGTTVTLTQPLGFARASIRTPDGELVLRPRVVNLSRNIVIRSEEPTGVRGHTASVGHGATWDIQYNELVSLGRTKNAPLDNTPADYSRAGTNQVGRYPDHNHHVRAAVGSRTRGNAYRGDGRSKWAVVIHQTDDVLVEENVCIGVAGACYITEDGNEARNVLRHNLAAYVVASGIAINQTQVDMDRGCSGCEGTGFWFRGLHQIVEANEAWNNAQGMNLVLNVLGTGNKRPITVPAEMRAPILFRGNVTASNRVSGLEYWGMPRFPADDHIAAHNAVRQVSITGPPGNNAYLRNLTAVASEARSVCVEGSVGYVPTVEVDGGRLLGCAVGASEDGIAIESATFRNVVMQNVTNFYAPSKPYAVTFENVVHKQLGNLPKRYIVFAESNDVWEPGEAFDRHPYYLWGYQRGSRYRIINWQGTGKNYQLFLPNQRGSTAAWPAYNPTENFNLVPEAGLTMKQAWDKYGMALRGEAVDDSLDTVPLEGLVNGLSREGLESTLGVPRAVLTSPNLLGNRPHVERGNVVFRFVLTGRRGEATDFACYRVNGGSPACSNAAHWQDVVQAAVPVGDVPAGVHTVATWRQTPKGEKVSGSDLTFQFKMGEPTSKP